LRIRFSKEEEKGTILQFRWVFFLLFYSVNINAMNLTKGLMHFRWLDCTA